MKGFQGAILCQRDEARHRNPKVMLQSRHPTCHIITQNTEKLWWNNFLEISAWK